MQAVFPSLVGGTQIRTNKFLVGQTELVLAKNVSSEILGSWKSRDGIEQTGDTLETDKDITGLFGDQNTDGKHLAVVNESGDSHAVLKWNNSGTWTNVGGATSLPADADVNFVSFLDQTYMFGANSSNEYLTTATIDGTTYSGESSFPKARYGIIYFDTLYLFDCEVGGVRYSNRGYYSSIPAYDSGWSISFDTTTDYLSPSTGDGDSITGVAESYGRLLVFKNYSIFTWDNYNLLPVDGIGCTSPKSIVEVDKKNIYFVHRSSRDQGMYIWDGTQATKMSRALDPFFNGSSGDSVGGFYQNHVYEFIGDVTLDADIAEYYGLDASLTNVMIDYSVLDTLFTIHTLPYEITSMAPLDNDLYMGASNGEVYKWDSGTSDNNNNIESEVTSHNFYGLSSAEFNLRKTFNKVIVNMHKPNVAKAFYSIDNGAWKSLGQLKEKVNVFSIAQKGYGIKIKVTSNFSDFIYEGYAIDYDLETPLRSK